MSAHAPSSRQRGTAKVAGTPVVSPTLVGRRDELSALIAAAADVPAVVVVEGEAGVGKTRLVTELLASAQVGRGEVLIGRCHPIRESFPLGPVIEAVRSTGVRLRRLELTPVAGALRPLLPELAAVLPALPDPVGDAVGERHRVFRGLAEILTALGPVVLVLEDLHWADEQTLDLVSYLVASPPPGLALVLTYRSEEASADVRALTTKTPPGLSRAHLAISPLDQKETGQLAAAILGAETVSEEFAEYLHERASGVPFVIEEVLALARSSGQLVHTPSGWTRRSLDHLQVPRGIRDSTLGRVSRLSAGARQTAEAMAVLQTPAAAPVLLEMSHLHEAADSLDEAIGSGLLVEEGEAVAFRHMLAAQAVYENLTGPRRRDLHARAAAALGSQDPVPLGQVAYHLRRAGHLAEWAVRAEAAADQAAALGHDTEAARLLEDVLRHAPLELEQRGRVAVKLARAAINTLHAHDVAGLLDQVLRQDPPTAVVRGEIRMLLADVLNQHGIDLPRQRELFAQAVTELTERPDLQAWALVGLGLPIYPDVPISDSIANLKRALALANEDEDRQLWIFLAGKVAGIQVLAGDRDWQELTDGIRRGTADAPRHRREINAFYTVGVEAGTAGHLRVARSLLTTGLAGAAAEAHGKLELMLRSALALLAYYGGEWDGLAAKTGELIESQPGVAFSRVDVELVAGCLALTRGEVNQALDRLTGLIDSVEGSGNSQLLPSAADAVTRALLSRGEAAAAAAIIRRCLTPLEGKGLWTPVARMLPSAVEALVAAGEAPVAAELAERAASELRHLDVPLAPAASSYARGVLTGDAGEFRSAAELYVAALAPYEAARAREQAARILIGARERTTQLRLAAEGYERLGANWDYARIASLARAAGITLPSHRRGRRGYGADLSPREREVAELVSRGLTNNAIAQELFVSVSTVEKHLIAVKRKLHAHSRTDLALRLSSRD